MTNRLQADEAAVIAAMRSIDAVPPIAQEPQTSLRRWESAQTDRLNEAHWQNANGQSINVDLNSHLDVLRSRCFYEYANNPIVQGVVNTHACDIVGPNGPQLQVHSTNEDYNESLEQLYNDWWAMPDVNGQLSGVDMLQMWIPMLWLAGEYTSQRVTGPRTSRVPVSLRLLNFHPDRLKSPADRMGDSNVVMGVRLNETGRPLEYYVTNPKPAGAFVIDDGAYKRVDAELMIHRFRMNEPHQVRGVPWLASSLQPIADLRDFGVQTLDAARQAADYAVVLSTQHPDAQYLEVNEELEIPRRRMVNLPPGWEASAMRPEHPNTSYVEFVREKLREIGRPVNMPLIIILLDSGQHNYSSARFDNLPYWRGVAQLQEWISRGTLNPLVDEVATEGRIALALPERPQQVTYNWTWSRPEHVDPDKESKAEINKLGRTDSLSRILGASGRTLEQFIQERQRDDRLLQSAGLPTITEMIRSELAAEAGSGEESGETTEANEDPSTEEAVA